MNALYAILFSNQTLKVGKTSNLSARINQHKGSAKSMGQDIVQIWVTPYPVEGVDSAENELISIASDKLEKITKEFFRCKSEKEAVEVIKLSAEKLIKCESVSMKKGNLFIEIDQTCRDKTIGVKIKDFDSKVERLYRTVEKFGDHGVSAGILRNRRRDLSNEFFIDAIERLKASGLISEVTKRNETNGIMTTWFVRK